MLKKSSSSDKTELENKIKLKRKIEYYIKIYG